MQELPEHVSAWLDIAEVDMASAKALAPDGALARAAGFHAQQAAEKYLKAVLAKENMSVPRIHDLLRLATSLSKTLPELQDAEEDIVWLSTFTVDVRYPLSVGLAVTRADAERAIAIAERIRTICGKALK